MADSGEQSDKPFLYDAFISYRHVDRDRKWAEWLIEALEGYRVPKSLRDKGLPPRLRKIFRDEDELPSSSDLNDQIREALVASRFLIVVCSAFTPRSKWVAREIEIFNELGRSDQVLALLTEGEPGDSFPDAMLLRHREVTDADGSKRIVKEDKEPLAADVRPRPGVSSETSKRLALLRLVAVILGVKFDELRQREHERERKQHLTWAAIAAALIVLIGAGGGFYWNMVRPKTTYYRDLVWRWGVPEGAFPIDAATHDRLPRSYRVITQRGKVVEVRHDGWTRAEPDGFARWVIHYGDDGAAQRINIFGVGGRLIRDDVLQREPSSNKMIVSFERNGNSFAQDANQNLVADTGNANPAPVQSKSKITRNELIFDNDGLASDIRYQDNWGTAQPDSQGSFGERFSYSPEGLVLRRAEIGPNGEEITLKSGVHAVASSYDAQGNLTRVMLLGEDGQPITGPDGYAFYTREYDSAGVDISQEYYGPDRKLTFGSSGDAKFVVKHDERGDATEVAYYDANGKLAPMKDGYAVTKRKFDNQSNLIEEAYFDADGRPTYNTLGFAGQRRTYDGQGNIIEFDYFGLDGKPAISKQGFAKLTRSFDPHGNVVNEAYFNVDNKPTISTAGYAGFTQEFNSQDERTAISYFDADRKPTLSKQAIAQAKYSYDPRGNLVESEYFSVDGKRALFSGGINGNGYAIDRELVDDHGNRVEVRYFGVDGEPVLANPFSAAKITLTFDTHGNITELAFFGTGGKPTLAPGGYAILRQKCDDRGNGIETDIFGLEGKPATNPEGFSRTIHTFDSRGRETKRAFFGADGKPTLTTSGNAGYRRAFDERGNAVETVNFGLDGEPVKTALGHTIQRDTFDDHSNRIERAYFGVDGKPIETNEKLARVTYAYDELRHETERAFFGIDGKPTLGFAGYAKMTWVYDARGNPVTKAYFGVDGEPKPARDGGYSKVTMSYDARGNMTEESFFGPDGKPAHDDGVVDIKYTYDDQGRQINVTYLDALNHEVQMELVVRRVVPGGAGMQAGLAPGDHILAYNGEKVTSDKQLNDLTAGVNIYRTLTVRRGSQILPLEVSAGSLDAYLGLARVDAEKETSGPASSSR